jgi:hypothetical protein
MPVQHFRIFCAVFVFGPNQTAASQLLKSDDMSAHICMPHVHISSVRSPLTPQLTQIVPKLVFDCRSPSVPKAVCVFARGVEHIPGDKHPIFFCRTLFPRW